MAGRAGERGGEGWARRAVTAGGGGGRGEGGGGIELTKRLPACGGLGGLILFLSAISTPPWLFSSRLSASTARYAKFFRAGSAASAAFPQTVSVIPGRCEVRSRSSSCREIV